MSKSNNNKPSNQYPIKKEKSFQSIIPVPPSSNKPDANKPQQGNNSNDSKNPKK